MYVCVPLCRRHVLIVNVCAVLWNCVVVVVVVGCAGRHHPTKTAGGGGGGGGGDGGGDAGNAAAPGSPSRGGGGSLHDILFDSATDRGARSVDAREVSD